MDKFITDFHKHITSDTENIVYSPHSICIALSMLHEGTTGEVRKQLAKYFYMFPGVVDSGKMTMANTLFVNKDNVDSDLRDEYKKDIKTGILLGLFLIGVFSARFCIEFLKENQVGFEQGMMLNMGQILSIPLVLTGIVLLVRIYVNKK